MSTTAVEKGLQFENAVVDMLNNCGFKAWRTNQSNEADPEKYKAGFDGGVDIIATFDVIKPICRNVCFYIQCKCHKEPLTKSAISEVYAGMHVRKGLSATSLPVVFATSDASQETFQYASDLGVELFLKNEFDLIQNVQAGLPIPYGNYGHLMRVILYHYTKDIVWIKTLPESQPPLGVQSIRDRMIDEANLDFEQSQTYLDRASNYERRAQEQRQKALDIQKSAVYRALQACSFSKKEHKQSSDTTKMLDDSG
jgi:hypothetical protein